MIARKGSSNFSEVVWFLEFYLQTGATVTTPTAAVTFNDGTTGIVNINALGSITLPANTAAGRLYQLVPTNGKWIRSVQTVTLSVSTGTAGNFGVTAFRKFTSVTNLISNRMEQRRVLPIEGFRIEDEACLMTIIRPSTTSSGNYTANFNQVVQES
jgi:predicted secreted protein